MLRGGAVTPYTFSIRADRNRNVMYISQRGAPNVGDLERFKELFIEEARKVERGFVIVNDQRHLEPFDEPTMKVAAELIALTDHLGASKVIRIAPADPLSWTKLLRAMVVAQSHYPTIRVNTSEEAEAALDES